MKADKIDEILTRGVERIYPSKKALEEVLRSGKKIRVYQGFDPSMPNLHIGNMVGVLKLKQFQELGHEVVFLTGDFTGMIGDPTDKLAARKKLTRKQVLINTKNWKGQASKLLNFKGENAAKLLFNSQWLDKISFKDLIEIASHFTAQQMLERDFFQRRFKEKKPVFLHELLYPVAQAIDCVQMDVDLEIGGTDQTFNMLAGRTFMRATKGKEKFVLTTKLLVDAKGEKVGKTAGNALFLNTSPEDMYGGIMSFPDETILLSFELLTEVPLQSIKEYEKSVKVKPMEMKKKLAWEIVKMYHGKQAADKAQKEFERVFQKRKLPSKMRTKRMLRGNYPLVNLVYYSGQSRSKANAKRLIKQGGIEVNGKTVRDPQTKVKIEIGKELVLKVGKLKFLKIKGQEQNETI